MGVIPAELVRHTQGELVLSAVEEAGIHDLKVWIPHPPTKTFEGGQVRNDDSSSNEQQSNSQIYEMKILCKGDISV